MMELNFEQIREMTWGAARITEENGRLCFYRCTKEQEEQLHSRHEEFYCHSLGSAGIKFVFQTNSRVLSLKVRVEHVTERMRFSFDVFSNGELVGYLDNFSDIELPIGEKFIELPTGDFEKKFILGDGEKKVCVHFPYSAKGMVYGVELDDGASFMPIKPTKKLLAYGDSITQGYYALRSSNRYVARLADYLDAEEVNKGIGSDRFWPDYAKLREAKSPDYIVVGYGTNDWRSNRTRETYRENSRAFIQTLREYYPDAKMIVITPIWRKDYTDERPFGNFLELDSELRDVIGNIEGLTIVRGFDLVPHEERYYGDLWLHPNDEGFEQYFKNLVQSIK